MTEDWIEDFNQWREKYDSMSFQDQQDFYEDLILRGDIGEIVKNQNYFDKKVATVCFEAVFSKQDKVNVLEMGGWRGEMAEMIFNKFPDKIGIWLNHEICEWAATNPVCKNYRYHSPKTIDFLWMVNLVNGNYDILILSHVLEHIKLKDLISLLNVVKGISYLYIDAPIEDKTESVNWKDYNGTHILEIGWNDLEGIIKDFGYEKLCGCTKQIKFYKHESKSEKMA